jgi:phospholipid transport system transporter-binding protein
MASLTRDDGRLRVSGPIQLTNVRALLDASASLLGPEVTTVDLSGVTEVDSSAVSLLLEWQRQAAGHGVRLRFAHLPPALSSLAELYGVSGLLPVSD